MGTRVGSTAGNDLRSEKSAKTCQTTPYLFSESSLQSNPEGRLDYFGHGFPFDELVYLCDARCEILRKQYVSHLAR